MEVFKEFWSTYYMNILFGAVLQGLICGSISSKIAKLKGYYEFKYTLFGFFFSFIGVIMAANLPKKSYHQ
ncbi:MAG: hypothetical protein AAGU39_04965 [Sedimentibacter saalensis]|uniref:hypothetical protein n=1 Tax=Sedimentibacter saalensis TaxID=130788 RepID=UPI003159294B